VLHAEQARTIGEILDIFVRVNSGGTVLTRSDLSQLDQDEMARCTTSI
jgi:hypothetical protein